MFKTIIGIISLLVPFLLVYRFKEKKIGFAYILSFLIGFHLIVGMLTQLFHIFSYNLIFVINLALDIVILTRINFKELIQKFKEIKINKIDWVLIFVIIVLFIELFSVHYNYTGKTTSVVDSYKDVKNLKYPYPYFSDEWSAVSLVKYSIDSGRLPLANPLWYNSFFPNLELLFHSFVGEITLLLSLNPLTQYTILSIFSGMLICLLVYFILWANSVGRLTAAIACLSVPYIVNGANIPGIWTLLPLIIGIILLLLGFFFMSLNKKKMVLSLAFLTLIFYPPLFVFYTISLILYFIFADISKKEKIKLISLYFIICIAAALIISFFAYLLIKFSFSSFIPYLLLKIFYETFTKNAIPDFFILKMIPILILLLSVIGAFKIFKKKIWLVASIFVGLVYWVLYSFVLWRFIIEYERVVMSTSILIVLLSGFGFAYLIIYFEKFEVIRKYKITQILQILILIAFFIFAFSYTQREKWMELKLYSVDGNSVYDPAAPANQYLNPDDLNLFSDIKEKRFLSMPWKGLVIGVATDNYPLETKQATLTNEYFGYNDFINLDCNNKIEIAKKYKIDYVYTPEFNCTGFNLKGVSEEGLYLYEVKN